MKARMDCGISVNHFLQQLFSWLIFSLSLKYSSVSFFSFQVSQINRTITFLTRTPHSSLPTHPLLSVLPEWPLLYLPDWIILLLKTLPWISRFYNIFQIPWLGTPRPPWLEPTYLSRLMPHGPPSLLVWHSLSSLYSQQTKALSA